MSLSPRQFDKQHLWHPYDHAKNPGDTYLVEQAEGVYLTLDDGVQLIDAMSSWWSVIHGYNHPTMNAAIQHQTAKFSHVMFGGLTHQPAIDLGQRLLAIAPDSMDKVFFADSGSIAVEVAMKMAMQYHYGLGQSQKQKFVTIRSGYHGDTWRTMSVCDPDTGMHHLFKGALPIEYFISQPPIGFHQDWSSDPKQNGLAELRDCLQANHQQIAAFILEPVVQGAGGMYFYHPEYLNQCRAICDEFDVLLIFDEIATGFGRTGQLFATDYCQVQPDILCLGKALTGGYMTLAATLTADKIAEGIAARDPGVFMHGPTFMANPLACAAANASLNLLDKQNWQQQVQRIERQLTDELAVAKQLSNVTDVRVLGGIGVIEMDHVVSANQAHPLCKELGVWLRPFGRCIYTMPPYITQADELVKISQAMIALAKVL